MKENHIVLITRTDPPAPDEFSSMVCVVPNSANPIDDIMHYLKELDQEHEIDGRTFGDWKLDISKLKIEIIDPSKYSKVTTICMDYYEA